MAIDRLAIITEALAEIEIEIWRETRYANNTGSCLWCNNGSLVMVPDDLDLDWFCQAKGAEALMEQLRPIVEAKLATAQPAVAAVLQSAEGGGEGAADPLRLALLNAGEALYAQGRDESLDRMRVIFTTIMRGRFKSLDPIIEQRIANASLEQIERWAERVHDMPRAILVVV